MPRQAGERVSGLALPRGGPDAVTLPKDQPIEHLPAGSAAPAAEAAPSPHTQTPAHAFPAAFSSRFTERRC